jgi:type III secretion protein T
MGFDLSQWPFQHLAALAYALPRILGVFMVLPLMGKETMPVFLRMALACSLAIFVMPLLLDQVPQPRSTPEQILVVMKETLLGFVLGFVLSIPLWAVEAMGDIADVQRGAAISQTLNPMTGHDTSPLGELFNMAVITFVLVIGGFTAMIGVLFESYRLWPVFDWWPPVGPDAGLVILRILDQYMLLSVLLASPVILVMFLAETGLALLSRFVPQLQVFFLAMPIKSALAMLMFALYAVVLFDHVEVVIQENTAGALSTLHEMLRGVRAP